MKVDSGADGDDVMSPDDRKKAIESAVATLVDSAPADWVGLHANFGLVDVSATVITESVNEPAPLPVPPEAVADIASHQLDSNDRGEPWQRLVIDYDREGRLSVRAVPVHGPDSGRWNDRVWSVATRSGPIVIQFVLGVLITTMWLLGKWSSAAWDTRAGENSSIAIAIAITVVISLVVAGVLVIRDSSIARGIGLSVAASAIIVLIGGAGVAYFLF